MPQRIPPQGSPITPARAMETCKTSRSLALSSRPRMSASCLSSLSPAFGEWIICGIDCFCCSAASASKEDLSSSATAAIPCICCSTAAVWRALSLRTRECERLRLSSCLEKTVECFRHALDPIPCVPDLLDQSYRAADQGDDARCGSDRFLSTPSAIDANTERYTELVIPCLFLVSDIRGR